MPDLAAFANSIQTPKLFHPAVGDIRNGKLLLTPLGLPRVSSGNFAAVFETEHQGQKYALRCFTKPAHDQTERFEKIAQHLEAHPCPYFVYFSYHPEGLFVDGSWQALMVMEWRSGVSFEEHVRSLLPSSEALLNLAGDWVDMFEHLRSLQIAHGDIHSDNVIVNDGQLYLIDYDAMHIPALDGRRIQEAGQRNFQHPDRNDSHYGPYMDHFPSWLVFYSLILLSIQPELWNDFEGGDQKLLFTVDDFRQPDQSRLFQHLERSENILFQLIARQIRSFLASDIRDIPPLSRAAVQAGALPLPATPTIWWVKPQVASDWWLDHVREESAKSPTSWVKRRRQ